MLFLASFFHGFFFSTFLLCKPSSSFFFYTHGPHLVWRIVETYVEEKTPVISRILLTFIHAWSVYITLRIHLFLLYVGMLFYYNNDPVGLGPWKKAHNFRVVVPPSLAPTPKPTTTINSLQTYLFTKFSIALPLFEMKWLCDTTIIAHFTQRPVTFFFLLPLKN